MWRFGLINDMNDPSKHVFTDEHIVILKDRFPKAERHFLVLPKVNIPNLRSVVKDDLNLLKHMDCKGREIAEKYGGGRRFKVGYHARPSLERLHLHVISNDLNSPSLKREKHWNSFTTPLFMNSRKVISDLETTGKIQFPSEERIEFYLMATPKCHKCRYVTSDLYRLKKHLLVKHTR